MPRKIEISYRTIIFTFAVMLGLWLVFQIRDILLIVFISLILTAALNPLVDKLESWKFPRLLAIGLLYVCLWTSIGLIVAGVVPSLVDQTSQLIHKLPRAIGQIDLLANYQQEITQQLLARISTLPENLLSFTVSLFGNLINVLSTLVITFYLLLERKGLSKHLETLFGDKLPTKTMKIINDIEFRLGGWIRGELILMLTVGVLTYVGLLILGIDIALPLAILAGALEIIPNIGPIISMVPAVLIALTVNPLVALATVALYYLVQLLENNLLVPKVMQKVVGVNPLLSILGLMAGFKLSGPAGAALAIPVIIILQTVVREYNKD